MIPSAKWSRSRLVWSRNTSSKSVPTRCRAVLPLWPENNRRNSNWKSPSRSCGPCVHVKETLHADWADGACEWSDQLDVSSGACTWYLPVMSGSSLMKPSNVDMLGTNFWSEVLYQDKQSVQSVARARHVHNFIIQALSILIRSDWIRLSSRCRSYFNLRFS